jgi:hypothetical protein
MISSLALHREKPGCRVHYKKKALPFGQGISGITKNNFAKNYVVADCDAGV